MHLCDDLDGKKKYLEPDMVTAAWCSSLPVCSLPGVGETQDRAELHAEDKVENDEGLFAQGARHVELLQKRTQTYKKNVTSRHDVAVCYFGYFWFLKFLNKNIKCLASLDCCWFRLHYKWTWFLLQLFVSRSSSWIHIIHSSPCSSLLVGNHLFTVRPWGKLNRSCVREVVPGALGWLLLPVVGWLWTELKSRGWCRPSCCSFSGFWVRVAENSSFWRGIWGGDRLGWREQKNTRSLTRSWKIAAGEPHSSIQVQWLFTWQIQWNWNL